jgi:O-succinylbenzoic acid--CoA ligase
VTLSILDAADRAPDRLALIAGTERLTFRALAERVSPLIAGLEARGFDGSATLPRIAIVGHNSLETVCFILAAIELGEPFALLHPRLTDAERGTILHEVRPELLLDRGAAIGAPASITKRAIPDDRCLALLYTSGSSGRAKGVMLSRRAFVESARASAMNLGWLDDDRWLACLPLAHVGALSIVTRCLSARRTIVLADASDVAGAIARESITIASLVPTMLRRLIDLDEPAPPSLRAILLGGAGAPASLLDDARARGLPVLTTYGLTEACSQVTTQRYGTLPSPEQGAGEPLDGYEVRIEGDEIQVKSGSVMSGYFPIGAHPDPFTADGFLRTGDLGRFDERGRLFVRARRTDLIVTGGENVSPAEVEGVLLAIPGVSSACVFGVPDETWGQIVAAAVVASDPVSYADVARGVAPLLAPFKWPRMIAFVAELPLTGSGKIDRAAVTKRVSGSLRPLDVRKLALDETGPTGFKR